MNCRCDFMESSRMARCHSHQSSMLLQVPLVGLRPCWALSQHVCSAYSITNVVIELVTSLLQSLSGRKDVD